MSASISRSPFLRKRTTNNSPLLGEWTCFKRGGDLLVVLGDVARINEKELLKDYFSFSMNAFITLWSQVGYLISHSEEELILNAKDLKIAKELTRLLPFHDATEFIAQHLKGPARLLLHIFNPILKENGIPTSETITIEPPSDEDEVDLSDGCEKSPEMDGKSGKQRSSKRGERALNELDCAGGNDDSIKKRKIVNLGEPLFST